jgi:hypothetical protein
MLAWYVSVSVLDRIGKVLVCEKSGVAGRLTPTFTFTNARVSAACCPDATAGTPMTKAKAVTRIDDAPVRGISAPRF